MQSVFPLMEKEGWQLYQRGKIGETKWKSWLDPIQYDWKRWYLNYGELKKSHYGCNNHQWLHTKSRVFSVVGFLSGYTFFHQIDKTHWLLVLYICENLSLFLKGSICWFECDLEIFSLYGQFYRSHDFGCFKLFSIWTFVSFLGSHMSQKVECKWKK